jgi:choline kinase
MAEAGLETPVFIGGYQIDMIRADYPQLEFCHNDNWPNNNILASLFYADRHMSDGFVCSYADILYRGNVIRRAVDHEGDIVLCVDVDWRSRAVQWLRTHHNRIRQEFSGRVWRDNTVFEKAYLIHLFQEMIEQGLEFHMVTTDGEYMEVDTEEDYALACQQWPERFGDS